MCEIKENLIQQVQCIMNNRSISKNELALRMETTPAQLDRILHPEKSITLATIKKLATALDAHLYIEYYDD